MLVLSREKHEAIVFSTPQGEVIVEVVEVRGDKVRLGIKCDKDIPVHRKESFDAIQREIDDKFFHIQREGRSHLELLMGAINNLTDQRCIDDVVVVANGEGAIVTTDDGVAKQNWDIRPRCIDIKPTKSNFDALGDDEDGCGPDGNYVDQ
jgi:carbon storage regulator